VIRQVNAGLVEKDADEQEVLDLGKTNVRPARPSNLGNEDPGAGMIS